MMCMSEWCDAVCAGGSVTPGVRGVRGGRRQRAREQVRRGAAARPVGGGGRGLRLWGRGRAPDAGTLHLHCCATAPARPGTQSTLLVQGPTDWTTTPELLDDTPRRGRHRPTGAGLTRPRSLDDTARLWTTQTRRAGSTQAPEVDEHSRLWTDTPELWTDTAELWTTQPEAVDEGTATSRLVDDTARLWTNTARAVDDTARLVDDTARRGRLSSDCGRHSPTVDDTARLWTTQPAVDDTARLWTTQPDCGDDTAPTVDDHSADLWNDTAPTGGRQQPPTV
ncbi:Protein of unknown function [Gryllus bimaculatus]|nr:Protein of unknown function [Gryllus bimaculatus]